MRLTTYLALFFLAAPLVAHSASLPPSLSTAEIDKLVETIGQASTIRLLRGAEPLVPWPGVRIGMQLDTLPTSNLGSIGDGSGSIPSLYFVPRIHLSKGLFFRLETVLTFFPESTFGMGSQGIGLKWTFTSERERWLAGAVFASVTTYSGFEEQLSGRNMEFGMLVSKDYVRITAYGGVGLLFANGSVDSSLARALDATEGNHSTLHLFAGGEWNLPVTLSFQIDFFNLSPTATLFAGKKF